MEGETQSKLGNICNLAHTVETIWTEVLGDVFIGSFDIRRVWDMNEALLELRKRIDELREELK